MHGANMKIAWNTSDSKKNASRYYYKGADKSLARPGREQATATEDFDVHISYLWSYLEEYYYYIYNYIYIYIKQD